MSALQVPPFRIAPLLVPGLFLSACQDLVTPEPAASSVGQAVPGRYIVVFAPGPAPVANEAARWRPHTRAA